MDASDNRDLNYRRYTTQRRRLYGEYKDNMLTPRRSSLHTAPIGRRNYLDLSSSGLRESRAISAASRPEEYTAVKPAIPKLENPQTTQYSSGQNKHNRFVDSLRTRSKLQLAIVVMAFIVFGLGLLVDFETLQTNNNANAQVSALSKNPDSVPSQTKPTPAAIKNYQVAPNLPRYITIPAIGVHARVLQVGVLANGALGTPPDIYDTAWYTGSAEPGQTGATLIDGHLDGYDAAGVFWNLHKLAPGDTIQIEKGDSSVLTYKVIKTRAFNINDPSMMASAIKPIGPDQSGLNLITCDGSLNSRYQYDQRLVVYASLQQ